MGVRPCDPMGCRMLREALAPITASALDIADDTHQVEWLIDNDAAYSAMIDAITGARCSVCISQLAFDADCVAYGPHDTSVRLFDAVVAAHMRGVVVRIVLNESLLVDTVTPLRKAFALAGASAIEVRGVSCFPKLLHSKLLLVDNDDAFLIGSPFVNGYWDDAQHAPSDARRPMRELGGRPLHDLSVRFNGPACEGLLSFFEELWSDWTGHRSSRALHSQPTNGVAVACTLPSRVSVNREEGCTEILDAMLNGISRARSLLYLEHQYLSSRRVVSAIADALRRSPSLDVVAVLNQNPDVTAYRVWQKDRLAEYGLLSHPRVGLFTLWSRETTDQIIALNQVFVHSKVIIVDDTWGTIGSANVDGVSLHSYGADFKTRLGERIFRHVRNIDLNLVIDGDQEPALRDSLGELRRSL